MSTKYTVGVDFGTLSARAVLVNVENGEVLCDSVAEYAHGVMDSHLGDRPLPPDFALQHPRDYLDALAATVSDVIGRSGVRPDDIIAIGFDFTTCTLLPVFSDGTPLCFDERFAHEPHAYVKLWKHHLPQPYADRLNSILAEHAPDLLVRYGGKTSAEWMFPKIMETLDKAPEVYSSAASFVEAGDFISWMLTSRHTVGYATAAYKALYTEAGYPSPRILSMLDPRLENVVAEKLDAPVVPLCAPVGAVSDDSRARFGLSPDAPWLAPGTVVASPIPDAHCPAAAVGAVHSGDLLASLGTSSCYMLISDSFKAFSGICGVVKDGIIPGLYAYESGLCCFGDHFAWAAKNLSTAEYLAEAGERGISPLALISDKAARLRPGESGVLALNWWNGNRNVLMDSSLSGLLVGMTLNTRPEEIFRAIVEANAFGTRKIFDSFASNGISIGNLIAVGGITRKSPFVMQLLADVLDKKIHVSNYLHSAALGASLYAAVAAGRYETLEQASEYMSTSLDTVYSPDPSATAVYDELYREYTALHDYFGRGQNTVMKRLRDIKKRATD